MPNWGDGDFYDVSFAVNKSRRYHAKMRSFYQGCFDLTIAATAITGSGAFLVLVGNPSSDSLARWLACVVAVASTLNLVFRFSKKADLHNDLCRRFTELAAKMEKWPQTPEFLAEARAARLFIEADEPTEKRLIDLQAQNEEARAREVEPEDLVPLSRWQRLLGYIVPIGIKRLEAWRDERKKLSNPPLS